MATTYTFVQASALANLVKTAVESDTAGLGTAISTSAKGDKGDTGEVGPAGPAGPAGAKGDKGLDGAGFNFRGFWYANTAYAVGDAVSAGGNLYRAKSAFTSGTTFDSSNWDLLVSRGDQGLPGASGAAAINVQKADGTWTLNRAAMDAAHANGSPVMWVTWPGQTAPTPSLGLAIGDPVDGQIIAALEVTVTTAPVAVDALNTANDAVKLTRAVGVTYTVDSVDHTYASFNGASTKLVPFTKGTATTVVAKAEPGFSIIGTTSWNLQFTNNPTNILWRSTFTTADSTIAVGAAVPRDGGSLTFQPFTNSVNIASNRLSIPANAGVSTNPDMVVSTVPNKLEYRVALVSLPTETEKFAMRFNEAGAIKGVSLTLDGSAIKFYYTSATNTFDLVWAGHPAIGSSVAAGDTLAIRFNYTTRELEVLKNGASLGTAVVPFASFVPAALSVRNVVGATSPVVVDDMVIEEYA